MADTWILLVYSVDGTWYLDIVDILVYFVDGTWILLIYFVSFCLLVMIHGYFDILFRWFYLMDTFCYFLL